MRWALSEVRGGIALGSGAYGRQNVHARLLQCPNIVGYVDAFYDRGSLCIVMEYADGGA